MEDICRLCFSVTSHEKLCKLTVESDIVIKLNSCLNLELNLSHHFPSQTCDNCSKKVKDIYEFYERVVQNELKLMECLSGNSLKSFYDNLMNKCSNSIKQEDDQDFIMDGTYLPVVPHISVDVQRIKSDNEFIVETKPVRVNRKLSKRPKIDRKVIKKDIYAEHDPNKCLTCFKLCGSRTELSKHYKNEHSIEYGGIPNIDTSDKYKLHKTDQKKIYKCNSCGDSNEDMKEMVKHVELHVYERPYICKLCGKTYKTVYEIVRHGRVHSGYRLFCHHGCGYSSPYPGAMRDHEKRHTDERNYTCKTCGKGFLVKTWFDQHQNIHNNVKPFVCDFCGLAFHMHRYLVTHRNKRHPGLSAIRKYTCTQCSFTCDNKNGLTTHMEEHASNPSEARLTLLCDVCGKAFARTDHLTNHKNGKHYGIKPYSCSVCNKQFQKKFNLTVHSRIHTGEGRHLCLRCGKHFAQKSTLYRHQKKRHPEEYEAIKGSRTK